MRAGLAHGICRRQRAQSSLHSGAGNPISTRALHADPVARPRPERPRRLHQEMLEPTTRPRRWWGGGGGGGWGGGLVLVRGGGRGFFGGMIGGWGGGLGEGWGMGGGGCGVFLGCFVGVVFWGGGGFFFFSFCYLEIVFFGGRGWGVVWLVEASAGRGGRSAAGGLDVAGADPGSVSRRRQRRILQLSWWRKRRLAVSPGTGSASAATGFVRIALVENEQAHPAGIAQLSAVS